MATQRRLDLLAGALILIFFFHALSESRIKSPTSDEPPHLASGLSYVSTGIFRGNPQHPPLLKELSGFSMLLGGVRWPRNPATERFLRGEVPKGQQPEWEIGNQIIAANGSDRVMFWARLPFLLIACLLGVLIYIWGRQLVGGAAALGAVLLYTTDPTILAHSFLVTMDVGLAAFTILLLFAVWSYTQEPTPRRRLYCGVALGLVLCAKFSAVLLLPVVALLLVFAAKPQAIAAPKAGRNDPCPCGSGRKYKACHGAPGQSRPDFTHQWRPAAVTFLVMCGVAIVVIQAVYFFRTDPLAYVKGAMLVNADHNPNYQAYMAGELQRRFTSYFAVAYLLKEPIAGIILAAAGLGMLIRSQSMTPLVKLFILVPPTVIFVATTFLADNIGVRYIMPVLPFAYLLGGLALATLFRMTAKWGRWAAVALCVWLVAAVAGVYPDHLSYFNESACLLRAPGQVGIDGGTKCGILWLDDSNVDWGQGLKQLKTWLDQNTKGRTVRFATPYAFPAETYGIPNVKADMAELGFQPVPGLYAVSAHLVARIPVHPQASAWLRQFPPVAVVGHALYVYDVPAPH